MNILAIESSCDETAAAIISGNPSLLEEPKLLSNVVVSQIDIFKAYGGVIPEVAARSHLEAILPVIHQAFSDAGFQGNTSDDWSKIDAIAVTHAPGLLGSLLIGTLTARVLAILHNKPLYAVHHLKSHIYANWINDDKIYNEMPQFPLLALVVSGGHTQIIRMEKHNSYKIIGTTLDDAVGECYDKIAKILGLPYPGGPAIAKAAAGEITTADGSTITVQPGDPKRYPFPTPQIAGYDFSFSGLKTAVLRAVQKEVNVPISYPSHELASFLSDQQKADFAASFQNKANQILLKKLTQAYHDFPETKSVILAGGVSANQDLRDKATTEFNGGDPEVYFPAPRFAGDNAAMVAMAAFYEIGSSVKLTDPYSFNIMPRSVIQ